MNEDGSGLRKVAGVGPAAWTPDGGWLAFNVAKLVAKPTGTYYRYDLWMMRPDGSERHLVARNVPLGEFSPDGKTIVFMDDSCIPEDTEQCVVEVDNPMEIYTIGVDGRHRRRLTYNNWYDGGGSWSPDGKRIAFESDLGVRVMDRDGGHVHTIVQGDVASYPLWAPRGDRILVSTTRGWGFVSPKGGKITYLRPGPRGPELGPTWSPDANKIAYLFRRMRQWTAHEPLQVWVMNADGSDRHAITKSIGWSPPSWARAR